VNRPSVPILPLLMWSLLLYGCRPGAFAVVPDFSHCPFLNESEESLRVTNDWFANEVYGYRISSEWEDPLSEGYLDGFTGESYYASSGLYDFQPYYMWIYSVTSTSEMSLDELKDVWLDAHYNAPGRDLEGAPEPEICTTKFSSGENAYFLKANYFKSEGSMDFHHYVLMTEKDGKQYVLTYKVGYYGSYKKAEADLKLNHIATEILTSFTFSPPQKEPPPPSTSTQQYIHACGNGVCEAYEFLVSCEQDCNQFPQHQYTMCRDTTWSGVLRVRILGTESFLEADGPLGPDLKPSDCRDFDVCGVNRYCHTVNDVHEPIFEIQASSAARVNDPCEHLILNYSIDGAEQGCRAQDWEIVDHKVYFPFDAKKYEILKSFESESREG